MKGVFVNKQLEYRLEVPQDRFVPGDALACVFSVKNHSTQPVQLADLCLQLAEATLKAARLKEADAFSPLQSFVFPGPISLNPQESRSFEWRIVLDLNCAISDKQRSLFLRYGANSAQIADLPLTVTLHPICEKLLHILETSFQFSRKGERAGKGQLEAKLKPPASARFTLVEELQLGLKFEDQSLKVNYQFRVKKFDTSENSLNVKKVKSGLLQELSLERYWPGGIVDGVGIEAKISEALGTVAAGV